MEYCLNWKKQTPHLRNEQPALPSKHTGIYHRTPINRNGMASKTHDIFQGLNANEALDFVREAIDAGATSLQAKALFSQYNSKYHGGGTSQPAESRSRIKGQNTGQLSSNGQMYSKGSYPPPPRRSSSAQWSSESVVGSRSVHGDPEVRSMSAFSVQSHPSSNGRQYKKNDSDFWHSYEERAQASSVKGGRKQAWSERSSPSSEAWNEINYEAKNHAPHRHSPEKELHHFSQNETHGVRSTGNFNNPTSKGYERISQRFPRDQRYHTRYDPALQEWWDMKARDDLADDLQQANDNSTKPEGSWKCPKCGNYNYNSRGGCMRQGCGEPRPRYVDVAGREWHCPRCGKGNPNSFQTCGRSYCDQRKPLDPFNTTAGVARDLRNDHSYQHVYEKKEDKKLNAATLTLHENEPGHQRLFHRSKAPYAKSDSNSLLSEQKETQGRKVFDNYWRRAYPFAKGTSEKSDMEGLKVYDVVPEEARNRKKKAVGGEQHVDVFNWAGYENGLERPRTQLKQAPGRSQTSNAMLYATGGRNAAQQLIQLHRKERNGDDHIVYGNSEKEYGYLQGTNQDNDRIQGSPSRHNNFDHVNNNIGHDSYKGRDDRQGYRSPPRVTLEPTEQKPTQDGLTALEKLRRQMAERGARGVVGLARRFRLMDKDGSSFLSMSEFKQGLRRMAVDLSNAEMEGLFYYFDKDINGHINKDEFIEGLKEPMNSRRKALVKMAFHLLDSNNNGFIEPEEISDQYDVSGHPDVVSRRKPKEEVAAIFLDTFEDSRDKDGIVSFDEFNDYYEHISSTFADDDQFELMMRNCWHISGGEGWSANTTNRRVLVEDKEGRQTIMKLADDNKMINKEAIVRKLESQGKKIENVWLFGPKQKDNGQFRI